MSEAEKIQAIIEDIAFQSEDNMFCVLRLAHSKLGKITAVYHGAAPFVGEQVELTGFWREHPRYGQQFDAQFCSVIQPTGIEGIERFLASGAVKGIGPALAHRIVEKFATETLAVLETQPRRLALVKGISLKKAEKIVAAYAELSDLRELMLFLEANGISSGYAPKLAAVYGNTAIARIKANPYNLATDISGIGFKTADRIAMALGVDPNSQQRISAGFSYALSHAATEGHTCVPEDLLVSETARLLNSDKDIVWEEYRRLLAEDLLRTEEAGGLRLIYPEYLYRAETETARRLLALSKQAKPLTRVNADAAIRNWEKISGLNLAEEQRRAIYASLQHGVLVLTGGPGTGKTTVVKGIMTVLRQAGCRILLAAPTGRAARRLAESAGQPAQTVHRLLEYQPMGGLYNFGKNAEDPLDADAVIVDEASMLDIVLTYYLLKAIPGGCRLIFVGDVDQLPSVSAGSVLKDIIRSESIPVVRLENVFRQAEVSSIVRNAHKINRGIMPDFTAATGDFALWEFADDQASANFVAETCLALAEQGNWRQVQVLAPMHKNTCGVQNLNKLLQQRLNPPAKAKEELTVENEILRVGDKVIQVKNNYEKDVFNGDIGQVLEINGKTLTVSFPDRPEGELVRYEQAELTELQLAYALSVHKSQGSEYPCVILLMVPSHYIMLQRNLLYTAVTRAKERVLIVGTKQAVRLAVANDKMRKRYSLLAERLCENAELF